MTCQKHPFSNLEKKEEKKLPYHVPAQNSLALHILQAELAHVEPPQAGVFLWVRRVVPGVQLIATKHDGLYHVAALRHLAGQTKLLLYRPRQQERQGEGDGGKVKRYKEEKEERLQLFREEDQISDQRSRLGRPQWRQPAMK